MSKKIITPDNLLDIFQSLDAERQQSLSDFAQYLYSLGNLTPKEIARPDEIPRPEKETVVGAIKRLKTTYHMIGSMTVFSEASALMTEHMVKGRDVVEVIDEMEALFERAYQKLLQEQQKEIS